MNRGRLSFSSSARLALSLAAGSLAAGSLAARLLSAALLLSGCGAAPPVACVPDAYEELPESHALAVIQEELRAIAVDTSPNWTISAGRTQAGIDLRLRGSAFGIEWVSAADRRSAPELWPEPAPGGNLTLLPGAGRDARAQVLVIDHGAFRFDRDRERVQHGCVGLTEVEGRLRREVRDFVHYARTQGGLPSADGTPGDGASLDPMLSL